MAMDPKMDNKNDNTERNNSHSKIPMKHMKHSKTTENEQSR